MAVKYLGTAFDIHAGGHDLVFPHHENEIAQSEAASGRRFARYWVHNGMVTLGDVKMSKSVGNVIDLTEALDQFGSNVLRLFLLSAHYRSPVDFRRERLTESEAALDRWNAFLRATAALPEVAGDEARKNAEAASAYERFVAAMDDDLSTPAAQAALFDLVSDGNRALERGEEEAAAAARAIVLELGGVLGFTFEQGAGSNALLAPLVEELLRLRLEARDRKDFATADGIRQRLADIGITVEDSAGGARWHVSSPAAGEK